MSLVSKSEKTDFLSITGMFSVVEQAASHYLRHCKWVSRLSTTTSQIMVSHGSVCVIPSLCVSLSLHLLFS